MAQSFRTLQVYGNIAWRHRQACFPARLHTIRNFSSPCRISPLFRLPGFVSVHFPAFDTSRTQGLKLPAAFLQGKDDGEHRSSAIAGTGDGTRGRDGGVGGVRGGEEEAIEAELRLPEYGGPFSDYSEIVLQYGYITMFASALPIVTFFAIAEVLLQIRTDRSARPACFSRLYFSHHSVFAFECSNCRARSAAHLPVRLILCKDLWPK